MWGAMHAIRAQHGARHEHRMPQYLRDMRTNRLVELAYSVDPERAETG